MSEGLHSLGNVASFAYIRNARKRVGIGAVHADPNIRKPCNGNVASVVNSEHLSIYFDSMVSTSWSRSIVKWIIARIRLGHSRLHSYVYDSVLKIVRGTNSPPTLPWFLFSVGLKSGFCGKLCSRLRFAGTWLSRGRINFAFSNIFIWNCLTESI